MLSRDQAKMVDAIPGWMGEHECRWQASIASACSSWTEVGSYCGRSAMAVGLFLPKGGVLRLVDVAIRPELRANADRLKKMRPDLTIELHGMPSVEAAGKLPDSTVVFIDADHTYESVKADILAWRSKCQILCGHDYQPNWAGVVRAVNELIPIVNNPVNDIWVRVL